MVRIAVPENVFGVSIGDKINHKRFVLFQPIFVYSEWLYTYLDPMKIFYSEIQFTKLFSTNFLHCMTPHILIHLSRVTHTWPRVSYET